jgi:hypothetical protein
MEHYRDIGVPMGSDYLTDLLRPRKKRTWRKNDHRAKAKRIAKRRAKKGYR